MQGLETEIYSFVGGVVGILTGIGIVVCILGIVVGGLMRATAFGNERKVARSNQAIACAVIGLLIVVLAQAAALAVNGFF